MKYIKLECVRIFFLMKTQKQMEPPVVFNGLSVGILILKNEWGWQGEHLLSN